MNWPETLRISILYAAATARRGFYVCVCVLEGREAPFAFFSSARVGDQQRFRNAPVSLLTTRPRATVDSSPLLRAPPVDTWLLLLPTKTHQRSTIAIMLSEPQQNSTLCRFNSIAYFDLHSRVCSNRFTPCYFGFWWPPVSTSNRITSIVFILGLTSPNFSYSSSI